MDLSSIKGMYAYVLRNRYIVLNNNLGEVEQRIVLAHELGHDQLHRGSCFRAFTDRSSILYETHRREIDANYFSAQLLIPDEDFFEILENFSIHAPTRGATVDYWLRNRCANIFNPRSYARSDLIRW
jgi:Zn-dependent peptidase ImmA (M78 family)